MIAPERAVCQLHWEQLQYHCDSSCSSFAGVTGDTEWAGLAAVSNLTSMSGDLVTA